MTDPEYLMYVGRIFSSQLTSNELDTIDGLADKEAFPQISQGIFDTTKLKTLVSNNVNRFTRTFKMDRRGSLFHTNNAIRMKEKAPLKRDRVEDQKEATQPPKVQRPTRTPQRGMREQRVPNRQAYLGEFEIPKSQYSTHPTCIRTKKEHTHTKTSCGFVLCEKQRTSGGYMGGYQRNADNNTS